MNIQTDVTHAASLPDAVLAEVASLLAALSATGEPGVIDLRGLPLSAEDLASIEDRLGEGEVHAEISASGKSSIKETAYSGVWRVRHFSSSGAAIADQIVIGRVPEILMAHVDDIRDSAVRLRLALNVPADAALPSENQTTLEGRL